MSTPTEYERVYRDKYGWEGLVTDVQQSAFYVQWNDGAHMRYPINAYLYDVKPKLLVKDQRVYDCNHNLHGTILEVGRVTFMVQWDDRVKKTPYDITLFNYNIVPVVVIGPNIDHTFHQEQSTMYKGQPVRQTQLGWRGTIEDIDGSYFYVRWDHCLANYSHNTFGKLVVADDDRDKRESEDDDRQYIIATGLNGDTVAARGYAAAKRKAEIRAKDGHTAYIYRAVATVVATEPNFKYTKL